MDYNKRFMLASQIRDAIADASVEYDEVANVLSDSEARQWIIQYIGAIHETDRHAPEPTAEDIRAMAIDLGYERDDSTDQVLDGLGAVGQVMRAQRMVIQRSFGVSPWGRGRLIEYAIVLLEMIDAGMGDMTLNDAIAELDTLTLERD